MKTIHPSPSRHPVAAPPRHLGILRPLIVLGMSAVTFGLLADDVTWTGGVNHGPFPAYWRIAGNWDTGTVPLETDNAIIGDTLGSTNAYIEFDATPVSVGSITVHPGLAAHNQILRAQSVGGSLTLYGVNGVLITNASIKQLQFTSSGGNPLPVLLAGSGDIGGGTVNSTNLFYSTIGEVGGSRAITKAGPNMMIVQSNCTHSGGTTLAEGILRLGTASATLGSGPIVFAGGELSLGASRINVSPFSNDVIVTGDSTISGDGGLTGIANARYILFNGTLSGSAGSLTIDNKGVSGNYFIARWISGVSFARPIVVGSDSQLPGRIAVLQLYNSVTNGTQTFSGPISGNGRVERTGATTSPGGTTVFTGDNTYSGGTIISYGTVLANNTAGSALGSGTVTVTNLGVLGGNGTIAATVNAGLNGTLSPGTSPADVANLNITDLKLEDGAHYLWQIRAATGTPGVDWDLITVNNSVWEAGTGTTPITIKVDSLGAAPTGWNPSTARDWLVISSGWIFGYDPSHFALDTTAFVGNMAGVFSLSLDGSGLHLVYTPAPDLVINVASGTQTQAEAGYPYITGALGMAKVGNGELVLDNPGNDYLGSTKILAGVLSLSESAMNGWGTLGAASTAAYLGHTTGNSNATLNIKVDGVTMARGIVVQAGSSGTKTIGTTLTSGTATYSGDVALQDSATLSAATGGTAQFNGSFSGAGGLALSGAGTVSMSGLGSYAGPTTIGVAALNLNSAALGTNTVTIASPLTLDNTDGAVTLNTSPQNWNADFTFVGTSSLNLGAGPVTLGGNRAVTVNNNTLTVGGPISGSAGLTKLGDGTLALLSPGTYTGGTTNLAGVLAVNGTATFGDGSGPLVLAGGNIACTVSHEATPIANPVVMTTDATIYGTSMATAPSSSYLPFTGPFTVAGGSSFKVGNTGRANNTFAVRLQGPDLSIINWPIVVGDAGFDTAGAISQLDFYSDTNAPAQFVNGLISGTGLIRRGAAAPNTGGTTILAAPNTFSGGALLTSGALGFGGSSIASGGIVTAGPLGTGLFTIGDQTVSETNMTVFAWGGPRVIENPIFLNGARNVVVSGTNDLTFTGNVNAGGIPKKWTVVSTGRATLAGQITSNVGSDGAPLTKAGDGVLVLSGDNLYTGATTVAEGTLLVNNTTGSGTGPNNVTVQAAGTIGGTGTVAGRITASGGRVAPGESVGVLTVGNGVNFSSGGTYVWELGANSTDPGSGDLLNVTGGNVVLGGSSRLAIRFTGFATAPDPANAFWQSEQTWTILALSGTAANPGPTRFASIENGVFPGGSFTNYADASGNIILQFVPGEEQPVIEPNIVGAGTADAELTWSAVSGRTYRVQYKTNLNQPGWLTLDDVPATGSTASIHDTTGPWPERYYRVIVP